MPESKKTEPIIRRLAALYLLEFIERPGMKMRLYDSSKRSEEAKRSAAIGRVRM
jgi:hypothetical protein